MQLGLEQPGDDEPHRARFDVALDAGQEAREPHARPRPELEPRTQARWGVDVRIAMDRAIAQKFGAMERGNHREDSLLFYEAVILLVRTGDALAARDTVRRALEAIDEDWLQRNTPRTAVAPKPIVDLAAPASTRKKDDPGKKIRRTKR